MSSSSSSRLRLPPSPRLLPSDLFVCPSYLLRRNDWPAVHDHRVRVAGSEHTIIGDKQRTRGQVTEWRMMSTRVKRSSGTCGARRRPALPARSTGVVTRGPAASVLSRRRTPGLAARALGSGNEERSSSRSRSSSPVRKAVADPEVETSFTDERVEKTKAQLMAELTKEDAPAGFSGLKGKALVLGKEDFPTMAEVADAIPAHCKVLDTKKSMMYFFMSTGICLAMGLAANAFIPMKLAYLPAWIAYAIANGTAGFGFWLMGHECGHFAFSNNLLLQDAVGFFSHTACLTPYFSWQRSHAVHHSKVNHMYEGESHVPKETGDGYAHYMREFRVKFGKVAHGLWSTWVVSTGWVLYLLFGASGGPAYGLTNHFWPKGVFTTKLFPKKWHAKVIASGAAVIGVVGLLAYWAKMTSFWKVAAVYGGPWAIVNAWLGVVTLLHHTDTDVPHLEGDEWNFIRGAFLTIDRPYYKIVDWIQHHIGSTHVLHHINPRVPHYHAQEATEAIKKAFPDLYLHDPTPVHAALWRVVTNCISVKKVTSPVGSRQWVYDDPALESVKLNNRVF